MRQTFQTDVVNVVVPVRMLTHQETSWQMVVMVCLHTIPSELSSGLRQLASVSGFSMKIVWALLTFWYRTGLMRDPLV